MKLSWDFTDNGNSAWTVQGFESLNIAFDRTELVTGGVSRAESHVSVIKDRRCILRTSRFADESLLELIVTREDDLTFAVSAFLTPGNENTVFNSVSFLRASSVRLGESPDNIRVLTESGYASRVRYLDEFLTASGSSDTLVDRGDDPGVPADVEPNTEAKYEPWISRGHWLSYDRSRECAILIGFTSADRWEGTIGLTRCSGDVQERVELEVGFDGGDTVLAEGVRVPLESFTVQVGGDPHKLLRSYATRAANGYADPKGPPPVSWCSWYPYRLSVNEERILQNAKIAAERLKPLGLSIIEADLGWEARYLPSSYDENEQFGNGLGWLSEKIGELGLSFGVWKAPYTVSEFDPLVSEHPEWLIPGDDDAPAPYWTWFWEPHGCVYILDLTHPEAQAYLRDSIAGLYDRGVRYFKPDFISCALNSMAKKRFDRTIVAGGGTEMARIGGRIIREALRESLVLNCGGPAIPGPGSFPLLYACNDTGNTGFISWTFMKENYHGLACHLFKNEIWGYLQPSCLCVGLPGDIEEARFRATIAFLTGGQIDISDDLTTLPEDRWDVILASLPVAPQAATPIDLFNPLPEIDADGYTASCAGSSGRPGHQRELPAGSVWHLHINAEWDEWDLIALYNYGGRTIFEVPHARIGLRDEIPLVGYEFWSGQFLGGLSERRINPPGTEHPGDSQQLIVAGSVGAIRLDFFGPAVKLVCIRQRREHPWIVGSTFHQSCGLELSQVVWDEPEKLLAATVERPKGNFGNLIVDTAAHAVERVAVNGSPTPWTSGANGSVIVPVLMSAHTAYVEVVFG